MGEPRRYFVNNLPNEAIQLPPSQAISRVENLVSTVIKKFENNSRNADGGLYVGLGGVSYMLLHLASLPAFKDKSKQYLEMAVQFLDLPLKLAESNSRSGHVTDRTGFMTGSVGVYAVAAVIFRKLGMNQEADNCLARFVDAGTLLKPLHWFKNGGDEVFVGRAGYLCALSWLKRQLGNQVVIPDAEVDQLLNTMVESGRQYSQAVKSSLPLMYHYYNTQYLGPAHGVAGILFVMLCFPDWLDRNGEAKALVQRTLDGLLHLQTGAGNFPSAMDEVGGRQRHPEDELVHWCHGAPGVVYLMAKAYLVLKDPKYLESALRCGEITWQKGLLKKGPGICHGVAGSGYVFLVLHQLTQDPRHLHRAQQFMNFMYDPAFQGARTPDSPLSLFEGLAGTACFAGDLTCPPAASFPFFNVV